MLGLFASFYYILFFLGVLFLMERGDINFCRFINQSFSCSLQYWQLIRYDFV